MNARSSQPSKSRFGLKDQSKDMSTVEIVAVFTTLLHFTKNMNIIPKVLEEKSVECLQQFKTRKCSLNQLKHDKVSQGISRRVSEWLVVNVHMVAKQATFAVTSSLQTHHIDTASVAGLENVCLKKGPVIEGEKMGIASQLRVISLSERGSAYETFH